MHVFWLNGNLVLEPENNFERQALGLLWENAKSGRPQQNDQGILPQTETEKRDVA